MYQRPFRPDELMHHGVLGMKWGVRHDDKPTYKDLKRLQNKTTRKMFKLQRTKNSMNAHLNFWRPDTRKRLLKADEYKRQGKGIKSKLTNVTAKALDPIYSLKQRKITKLNKQINKSLNASVDMSLSAADPYVKAGEEYFNAVMERYLDYKASKIK